MYLAHYDKSLNSSLQVNMLMNWVARQADLDTTMNEQVSIRYF
jgi:hypothetical protein